MGYYLRFVVVPYIVFKPCVNYLFYVVRPLCLAFRSFKVFFFSIVLLVSYICKVWVYMGFCGLVGGCMFALTNYNNKTL